MAIPSFEATVNFSPPHAGKACKTWYTIFGNLSPAVTPLICLHGGPGVPHNYILPIRNLWTTHQIPVIFYDQLGCGNSTRLPEKLGDESFWTPELFLSELDNLLSNLGIQEYDLLGQSWGGMLAACHAVLQPKGLRKLVIADSPASMELWVQACDKLRGDLPAEVQKTLLKHEKEGTTDSKEYEEAIEVFYDRHVCRVRPWPEDFAKSSELLKEDNTVYMTMNGPNEFYITGTLKTWSIVADLHNIVAPTLLINGKYDEAQSSVMEPFFKSIANVTWERFDESSHLPQLEEPKKFLEVVGGFLTVKESPRG